MPKPRYKSFIITNNGKVLRAFYAGRNAKAMKEDATAQFFRVFGQGVMDGGASPDADIKEKFYSDNPWAFNADVENQRLEGSVVEYTPKLEGIGERWLAYPKPVEETNLDPIFGLNGGESVPPSLAEEHEQDEAFVGGYTPETFPTQEDAVYTDQYNAGAAVAPVKDPEEFETVTPPTIPAPTEEEQEESTTQRHEIIDKASGARITFDTEGDPEWNGREIPEGYRRIDGDPVVEVAVDKDAEKSGSSVVEVDLKAAEMRVAEWARPQSIDIPKSEDLGHGIPDQDYPDSSMYDKNDIIVHEQSSRLVSAVHGLPYDEMDYSKGDARYIAEDGKLDRPQEFGPSEYERARNNIRPIDWGVEASGEGNGETAEQKKERLQREYEQIDTGKLRNPDNMRREAEEMRKDPTTSERKEEKSKHTTGIHVVVGGHATPDVRIETPKPGRRSNALFGAL